MKNIKINLFWHAESKYGDDIALILYRYFCSGEYCLQKDACLGIPIDCYRLENTEPFELQTSPDTLTVNVLIADLALKLADSGAVIHDRLAAIHRKYKNTVYFCVAQDRLVGTYFDPAEYVSLYHEKKDNIDYGRAYSDAIAKFDEPLKSNIRTLIRELLYAIVNRYFNFVTGKDGNALRIFLSHTKSSPAGIREVSDINRYLSDKIKMAQTFVDYNSIDYGENFKKAIYFNATKDAMLVLLTDNFSAREWCQREIFYAKKYRMPIVIVDALQTSDERLFAYIGNVPIVKYDINDMEYLLETFAFEILSNLYHIHKRDYDTETTRVLGRKVELLDIVACDFPRKKGCAQQTRIIYPDPPVYWTENDIISNAAAHYGVSVDTPITLMIKKNRNLRKCNVLISSSKSLDDGLIDGTTCIASIDYALKEITRFLIFNGFTIINGGHFEEGGFNEIILDQILHYRKRLTEKKKYGICYVNAYNYKKDKARVEKFLLKYVDKRRGHGRQYKDYIDIVLPDIDGGELDLERAEQMRIHRERITDACGIHIVVGGKKSKDAETTGIDVEVDMSIAKQTPIYLLGGFGYKAKQLCEKFVTPTDFAVLHNGLTFEENKALSQSRDFKEILHLILKGYSKSIESVSLKHAER